VTEPAKWSSPSASRTDVAAHASVVQTKVRIPRASSMPLERLDARLDAAWGYRLALVVAPAGSGKTTLLARFAERVDGPVGWYRAEAWDADEDSFLRHLEAALAPQLNGLVTGWSSVADAANALDAWQGRRVLLVVDDLHTLEGTPAEAALERLVEYAPPTLTVLAATRVPPRFNLPRLRVSGALLEIGSDELRFRSWEVERLFRDHYQNPLPPEELARLARRTEGWAAGLQLFHLATHGRAPDERRRVLAALGPSSRLMRDYLTRNVLDQLPAELRRFLVETSVLGRLSAALCDRLLDRGDSAEMLAELEWRNLFTQALAEEGIYRYHEVLRSYLQGVLLAEVGERAARERFRAAGKLLAEAGALPEALDALCRAEDWEAARSLLGQQGEAVAGRSSAWIDALPASMLVHDPWLLLASARRLRAEGRFAESVDRYHRAELAFGHSDPAQLCRDERQAVAIWFDADRGSPRRDWWSLLRSAVAREPMVVARAARDLSDTSGYITEGLAALLAGEVAHARRTLLPLAEDEHAGALPGAVAATGAAIAELLSGHPHAAIDVEAAVAAAENLGLEWLARLGRASLALGGTDEAIREALAVASACTAAGDRWGAALARLFATWGGVLVESDAGDVDGLALEFRALGAPVLEAWARGLGALVLASAHEPDARDAAVAAEMSARSAGVPQARLLSYLALAQVTADEEEADEYRTLAAQIATETGLALPVPIASDGRMVSAQPIPMMNADATQVTNGHANNGHATSTNGHGTPASDAHVKVTTPPIDIRMLGGFGLAMDGQQVDLAGVRPRVRALLRLLCLNTQSPVHHETIEAALWPEVDASAASRNLHVAIAALRRAIEPSAARGGFQLVRRDGDAYRLVLPRTSRVDLDAFELAVSAGRAARERGDSARARQEFAEALDAYGGELLPEDGPAEWVVERRERCRLAAVETAVALAELLLEAGDADAAARACTSGLRIERYHDPLWRLLIRAREAAGDQGAALRARASYGKMLADLGVEAVSAV
jgi:DNA-binding SARP family transcriptional activator